MINKVKPKGVLQTNYADSRQTKKELDFRFRMRGYAVAWAARKYLDPVHSSDLTLLDMGAADGKTLKYIDGLLNLKRGVGIEYNSELINKAEKLPANLHLKEGYVTNLSNIDDNTFTLCSALALLEHLPEPLFALREASRILKPRGLFVISSPVPYWDHLSVRLGLLAENHHVCDMHKRYFMHLIDNVSDLRLAHFLRFMWAPTGLLPYLGLSVYPERAFSLDRIIERMKVTNWLFYLRYKAIQGALCAICC
ncbi:MAG: class I SAM-dependent methyltransferase [Fibrobacterota bacterium]